MAADISVRDGDLVEVADVEAIVNAWNRNVVPWWLLYPSGVSKAVRRRAGVGPFRELARHGRMPLGAAVTTGAGPTALPGDHPRSPASTCGGGQPGQHLDVHP
ncbi:MAG TPA: hypothetical protein VFK43_10405, partial [Acidimicrobiales bacterium]|nr:hypothetical protein [Acidimicrobiales bacterium]